MITYELSFQGMSLGGVIIVSAPDEDTAKEAAVRFINENDEALKRRMGRPIEKVDLDVEKAEVFLPYLVNVLHYWNGDY